MKIPRLHIPVFLLAIAFVAPEALCQVPNIKTVSPSSGITGTSVTISDTNLGSTGTVTFNGVTATNAVWGATSISVPVPNVRCRMLLTSIRASGRGASEPEAY